MGAAFCDTNICRAHPISGTMEIPPDGGWQRVT